MNQMEVVYTASRNLYPYLMASVQSLLDHNPEARVWLLIEDDSIGYDAPQNVEIVNVSGQNLFGPGGANWRTQFTYMALIRTAYSKLFTGEPNDCGVMTLPKLDRIIQLDVDTIVCDSLEPIWDADLEGKWFAGVPSFPSDARPFGKQNKYYNLGVAVFNLDQIRRDGIDDTIIKALNNTRMLYVDEMAWNRMNIDSGFRKSVDLPPRYNQTTEVEQTLNPAIVHYAGVKDWWMEPEKLYRGHYLQKYAREFRTGVLT